MPLTYSRLLNLAAVVIVVAALYLAQDVLIPVALAIFLAFVLSPLVVRLERRKFGHVPSVALVTLFAFSILGTVGWIVAKQSVDIVTRLPEYRDQLQSKLDVVREKIHKPLEEASSVVKELGEGINGSANPTDPALPLVAAPEPVAKPGFSWLSFGLDSVFSLLATAGVVAVLTVLMLAQRSDLRDRFIALAGGGGVVLTTQALDEGGRRLSRYLLVLTAINGGFGVAVGAGLWLLGVPNSLLWGLLAAILRFIPYVGPWVAASFPLVFSLAILPGLTTPLLVLGLFILLEIVAFNVIEPLVFPNHIGVSSTALVVSAVFWTWLWGLPGLAIATPLTLCLAVLGEHMPQLRFLSVILGDKPVLAPAPRLYQRLLAGDVSDAWSLLTAEVARGGSLVETCDRVVIPALVLAQQDRRDRVIEHDMLAKIAGRLSELLDRPGLPHATPETALDPASLRVLCLPAGKEADGVALRMMRMSLRLVGIDAHEATQDSLVSEKLEAIQALGVQAVCISDLPPVSFSRLRYLCKRIVERFPAMPILIGTWTLNVASARAHERLACEGDIKFVSKLAEMQSLVQQIGAAVRAVNPVDRPATAAARPSAATGAT